LKAFNSLWYPSFEYDLPMFGVDLISIESSRILIVMDFQPLEQSSLYDQKYIVPLQNVRRKYPDLQESISTKFYDDISIFSNQMLIGRFKNESNTNDVIFQLIKTV